MKLPVLKARTKMMGGKKTDFFIRISPSTGRCNGISRRRRHHFYSVTLMMVGASRVYGR
jgi:hypothetical protein